MNKILGWFNCLVYGVHDKNTDKTIVVDTNHKIEYWTCNHCGADNYRDI